MQVTLDGIGVWGPGFCSFAEFAQLVAAAPTEAGETIAPKPELIPARERRRSPLMVRLAVEVAVQACEAANIAPADAHCVFSSGIGDADLTDYMCRVLAGPDKLLSPTKFHNSVHNAAVGYWSISTGCEQPASFVSSLQHSFSAALMEAMVQAVSAQQPVLLVLSELPIPVPMHNMHPIDDLFAAAFVLSPAREASPDQAAWQLAFELQPHSCDWPLINTAVLQSLYSSAPAARALCLLESLCRSQTTNLLLPISEQLSATLSLQAPGDNR